MTAVRYGLGTLLLAALLYAAVCAVWTIRLLVVRRRRSKPLDGEIAGCTAIPTMSSLPPVEPPERLRPNLWLLDRPPTSRPPLLTIRPWETYGDVVNRLLSDIDLRERPSRPVEPSTRVVSFAGGRVGLPNPERTANAHPRVHRHGDDRTRPEPT